MSEDKKKMLQAMAAKRKADNEAGGRKKTEGCSRREGGSREERCEGIGRRQGAEKLAAYE
jgi:hypothetical protein